jgi:putative flippase GtrA
VADVPDTLRAKRFTVATAIGFTFANVFCWLMNRLFVFEPGLYSWYIEFLMFFASSALSVGIALYLSWALIKYFSISGGISLIEVILAGILKQLGRSVSINIYIILIIILANDDLFRQNNRRN